MTSPVITSCTTNCELRITATPDVLVIDLIHRRSRIEILTAALTSGGCGALLAHYFLNWRESCIVGVLVAAGTFAFTAADRHFQLRVSANETVSLGRIEGELSSRRCVPTQHIEWLEYQEDATGPESSSHPQGLYAVSLRRSTCLLPHINEADTAAIINRIYEQFSTLRSQVRRASPFGRHIVTLGLEEPK